MKNGNDMLKKLKIGKAQQTMLGAVAVASFVLGICLVIAVYFLKYIRFDAAIISEKDKAIDGYNDTIKNIGICTKPRGKTYSAKELERCVPDEVSVDDVSGSLRANVLINMAQNENLESVARNGLSVCVDSSTGEKLSYERLMRRYENSTSEEDRLKYYQIYTMCSALRAIPDALPAAKNELALMASIDKIFKVSGWEPDNITPGGDAESAFGGLGATSISISMQTSSETAIRVLRNLEKSIRDIDVEGLSLEWSGGRLNLSAKAKAYYTEPVEISEGIVTVRGDGRVTRSLSTGGSN
ncbi:hypothetical protein IKG02_00920 [Candidatus Saccharibacteria bacterium]|nr:hypothetical protein [Candidatus Saccharibacteria bacterium]